MRRRVLALTFPFLGLGLLTGCGSGGDGDQNAVGSGTSVVIDTAPATAVRAPVDLAVLPRVNDVAELAQRLTTAGLPCELAYEGIRDDSGLDRVVSICTVADEQAYLYLWNQAAELQSFADDPGTFGSPVVVGANWSISTGTQVAATQVAEATGGQPLF